MNTPQPGERWRYVFEGKIDDDGDLRIRDDIEVDFVYKRSLRHAVSAERLPDPEPQWQSGDVVLDADGVYYLRSSFGHWNAFGSGDRYGDTVPRRPLTLVIASPGKPRSEATS